MSHRLPDIAQINYRFDRRGAYNEFIFRNLGECRLLLKTILWTIFLSQID